MTAEIVNGILLFSALCLQLIGVAWSGAMDFNLDRKRKRILLFLVGLSLLLVLQNYSEYVLVEYVFAPKWRILVAAFGYSIRPAIIVLFVRMIAPERKNLWMWGLVAVNAVMYFTAFFTPLFFTITDENVWGGGPLNDLCLIVSGILLAFDIFHTLWRFRHERKIFTMAPLLFVI